MADDTHRIAGTANLSIDGRRYFLKGSLSYKCSGFTREPIYGKDGFHGYKETPVAGSISFTLTDTGGLSVSDLGQITNSSIVAELANGKTVIGRNMFNTEQPSANADESEVEVTFNGPEVTDVL